LLLISSLYVKSRKPIEITTDGQIIIIKPVFENKKFGKTLKRLAE
jgi:hypothetical protein